MTDLYSLSITWNLKHENSRLNYLTNHGLWYFKQDTHNHFIFAVKVNISGIFACITFMSYSYLFFFFWSIFILFDLFLFKSFDLSFRTFLPSVWILLFFHFFLNMGKQIAESKVCTYLKYYQKSIPNYESYTYRTLTHSYLP